MPRVDYDRHGRTYARHRREDPRIAARIHEALGDTRTLVNVGAGTGSCEPDDRWVLAVEPSATMRAQRSAGAAPAVDARAEAPPGRRRRGRPRSESWPGSAPRLSPAPGMPSTGICAGGRHTTGRCA